MEEGLRQGLNGVGMMNGGIIFPQEAQASLSQHGGNGDEMCAGIIGTAFGAALVGVGQKTDARDSGAVDLAQEVEQKLGPRKPGKSGIAQTIAEKTVGLGMIRGLAGLTMDGRQSFHRISLGGKAESQGIEGGEPAHGAGEIHGQAHVIPTMTLYIQIKARFACPIVPCPRQ